MLPWKMKSARRATRILSGVLLCQLPVASRVRAAENIAPPVSISPMTDESTPQPAIVVALQKATEGLLMPSETDAPFQIVFFALETGPQSLSMEQIAKQTGAPDDAKIETRDLSEFFAPAATIENWMNDDEKATAQRFASLLEILQTQLQKAQVLVWGDAEKRVAIIGKTEGGLAGVTTLIVET